MRGLAVPGIGRPALRAADGLTRHSPDREHPDHRDGDTDQNGPAQRLSQGLLWIKATGKEPSTNPEDPQVALPEALSWSMLMGVVLGTARVLAVRAARSSRSRPAREPIDAVDS